MTQTLLVAGTAGHVDRSTVATGLSRWLPRRNAPMVPTTDTNPVRLNPCDEGENRLVIHDRAVEHYDAERDHTRNPERPFRVAVESYKRLTGTHDVMMAERVETPPASTDTTATSPTWRHPGTRVSVP